MHSMDSRDGDAPADGNGGGGGALPPPGRPVPRAPPAAREPASPFVEMATVFPSQSAINEWLGKPPRKGLYLAVRSRKAGGGGEAYHSFHVFPRRSNFSASEFTAAPYVWCASDGSVLSPDGASLGNLCARSRAAASGAGVVIARPPSPATAAARCGMSARLQSADARTPLDIFDKSEPYVRIECGRAYRVVFSEPVEAASVSVEQRLTNLVRSLAVGTVGDIEPAPERRAIVHEAKRLARQRHRQAELADRRERHRVAEAAGAPPGGAGDPAPATPAAADPAVLNQLKQLELKVRTQLDAMTSFLKQHGKTLSVDVGAEPVPVPVPVPVPGPGAAAGGSLLPPSPVAASTPLAEMASRSPRHLQHIPLPSQVAAPALPAELPSRSPGSMQQTPLPFPPASPRTMRELHDLRRRAMEQQEKHECAMREIAQKQQAVIEAEMVAAVRAQVVAAAAQHGHQQLHLHQAFRTSPRHGAPPPPSPSAKRQKRQLFPDLAAAVAVPLMPQHGAHFSPPFLPYVQQRVLATPARQPQQQEQQPAPPPTASAHMAHRVPDSAGTSAAASSSAK